ncbi:DMT family transporter [Nakamurella antarctica]|uniref:DMT family transporter n=1 Tax=Nakamurella antarctica TaxID=1902245 RepID=A0A3G8ZP07_9ACTN|nr:DMT family transporter [Nakamurella antarctica]AZI59072.1 DMT family transporter [Nakamurella antarctica]
MPAPSKTPGPVAEPARSRQSLWALVALLSVAAAWGSSFPLTKDLLERMSAVDFLAVRFTLATVVMFAVFSPAVRRLSRASVKKGLVLGALYGIAQVIQTSGLAMTSASVSGFITGMYVVLTPICAAVLLKKRITGRWWVGAVMAMIGLAVMALNGFSVGLGEGITLLAALLFALHIVGLSHWSTGSEALGLAVVQIAATAAISVICAGPGGISLPTSGFDWAAIVYMAIVSGALAMILQSWAQAHLPASRAAIAMATEPVWAAALAITFLHEPLTARIGLGGALMLAAMLVVEVPPRQSRAGSAVVPPQRKSAT